MRHARATRRHRTLHRRSLCTGWISYSSRRGWRGNGSTTAQHTRLLETCDEAGAVEADTADLTDDAGGALLGRVVVRKAERAAGLGWGARDTQHTKTKTLKGRKREGDESNAITNERMK